MSVDYVPFATGGGASVYNPATYQALAVVATGVQPGLADPLLANTTWRLASVMVAAIGNFIANTLGINVLDDGNVSALTTNFGSAVSTQSNVKPGRIVTSSATLNMVNTDYAIGLNRTAGVAAMTINLPPTPAINQEFLIQDLQGNFNGNVPTLTPPGGHNIAGAANWPLNVNRGSWLVHYYGSSTWGIARCAS